MSSLTEVLGAGVEPDEAALRQRVRGQHAGNPRKVRLNDTPPAALGNGLLTWAKSEPGASTSEKAEADVKHEDAKPDIKPDVSDDKPDDSRDVKPPIFPGIKPPLPSDFDTKPSSSALQGADVVLEPAANDGDSDDDDAEEEDYSEDIIVAPWGANRSLQSTINVAADDEESEVEVYSEDEVEDVYSEDESANCGYHLWAKLTVALTTAPAAASLSQPSTQSSQSQSLSLVPVGSKMLAVKERPAFPCTDEQMKVAPYGIDPDDPTMVIPASINRFLRKYQREGVDFFYSKYKRGYGGILGDDMG